MISWNLVLWGWHALSFLLEGDGDEENWVGMRKIQPSKKESNLMPPRGRMPYTLVYQLVQYTLFSTLID